LHISKRNNTIIKKNEFERCPSISYIKMREYIYLKLRKLEIYGMAEAKKNERANALKEVNRLCKEFDFTAEMLKNSLAEGRGE
jgi:hypothetical protein